MTKWVDLSTIVAAAAGLWAISIAWFTYVMSVRQKNHDEFLALKNIAEGLRVDLELMKPWTGAGGPGYSKKMTIKDSPTDWSMPGRLIWKFSFEAVANLSSSPYLYRLRDIVVPFTRLNFSISRLFQLYDEYRLFVNNHMTQQDKVIDAQIGVPGAPAGWDVDRYQGVIRNFNFQMHVGLIGGEDSDDQMCLYKAYNASMSALNLFNLKLTDRGLAWWYWAGHVASLLCFASGVFLLFRLIRP
jgi:hypothetical protein